MSQTKIQKLSDKIFELKDEIWELQKEKLKLEREARGEKKFNASCFNRQAIMNKTEYI